jgi:DNA mismatch repair protein MSH5
MLIMTGPNYSGKTVLLKQIALIVYMAHIGRLVAPSSSLRMATNSRHSYVPAKSAIIGVTDKILSRIVTRETVSKAQSAFMIDLQQITMALSQATRQSLIVIDEFGKGTNVCDGAGLACGVLEYLLGLGRNRPRVLAATHFHGMCRL